MKVVTNEQCVFTAHRKMRLCNVAVFLSMLQTSYLHIYMKKNHNENVFV